MEGLGLKDILFISPLVILFLTSLVPITVKVLCGNREQPPVFVLVEALIGLVASMGLLLVFSGKGQTAFHGSWAADGVTLWSGLLALLFTLGSLILAYEDKDYSSHQFSEKVFLILNSTVGILLMVAALDLLTLFIGLEIMSLSLYLLIAMGSKPKNNKEAAFKYFVLGSFVTALFLYGTSFIFGNIGTVFLVDIAHSSLQFMQERFLFVLGMTLIILAFCFKVAVFPFHFWAPDVYQGAPTPLTSFMTTAVKVASFVAFLRIVSTQPLIGSETLFNFMQWLSALTILFGNVAALLQKNFKRMLAYSSVAHSGYILMGVIACGANMSANMAAPSVLFYLMAYGLMTLGAFYLLSLLERREGSEVQIENLSGLSQNHPFLALCFSVVLLSLAGVPPTLGFFAKFYLFTSALDQGLLWLAIWGVIGSLMGIYYYLYPIIVMYMKKGNVRLFTSQQWLSCVCLTVVTLALLFLGIFSGSLFTFIERLIFY